MRPRRDFGSVRRPRAGYRDPLSREHAALRFGSRGANEPVPLKRAGVRIGLHAKSLVIDGRIGVVGTHNFDPRGDDYNTESAVVIEDGAVDFSQLFERTLQRAETKLSPSVLIHGLGPSAIAAGSDPVDALLDFMDFVGDSPLLAFHAPFDQHMLCRALKDSLGYRLQHSFLDVAEPRLDAARKVQQTPPKVLLKHVAFAPLNFTVLNSDSAY